MCPQPLSTFKGDQEISISTAALKARPELAAMVMEVVGLWAHIDHVLSDMTASLMKADMEPIADVMASLTGHEPRNIIINAAITHALSPEDANLYRAIHKATSESRARRNDFCHHIWCIPKGVRNSLGLIDPRYLGPLQTKLRMHWRKYYDQIESGETLGPEFQEFLNNKPDIDKSKVYVYKKADLERDVRDAHFASDWFSMFSMWAERSPGSARMHSTLLSQSEIARALQPMTSGNAKQAQPSPPRRKRS